VTDFGIAKAIEGDTQFTASDVRLGTPRYMSPEQVQGEGLDARSDIFSLGVVLFQMLTGKGPFGGESFLVIMRKIIEVEPELSPEEELEIPIEVRTILKKTLAKKPGDRYQTASELTGDIEKYQNGGSISETSSGRNTRKWIIPFMAAVLVLGLIGAFFLFRSNRNLRPVIVENRIDQNNIEPEPAGEDIDQHDKTGSSSATQESSAIRNTGRSLYEKSEQFWKDNPTAEDTAISGFQEVIDSFPGSPWAHKAAERIRSISRPKEIKPSEAAILIPEQEEVDRKTTEAEKLIQMGIRAMTEENWEGAIFSFNNAALIYPLTLKIKNKLNQAYINKWLDEAERATANLRPFKAIALYDQILELAPENQDALREKKYLEEVIQNNKKLEEEFKAFLNRGLKLINAGDAEAAIPVLEKALAIKPTHQGAQHLMSQARKEAEKLTRSTLILKVKPARAVISVDDEVRGLAGEIAPLIISPGRHVIKASCPDYQTHAGTVTLRGGKSKTVTFSLKKKARLRPVVVY